MDVREHLRNGLRAALAEAGIDPLPDDIALERPANRDHGDWSSNIALATAKKVGKNPRELGQALVDFLARLTGPCHRRRDRRPWVRELPAGRHLAPRGHDRRTRAGCRWIRLTADLGAGAHLNIEFVSANPNKPLHAGHGRGACYGDSIARLKERCGFRVTRETYINDRGVQMTNYARSLAAAKADEPIPEDGYHGAHIHAWAGEMPADADPLEWGLQRGLDSHRATLEALDIHHEVWFSERSLVPTGAIDDAMDDLRAHNAVFEDDGAVWLRSTEFGDDKDRVLVKSDGDLTYLTPDIAYHRDKFSRSELLFNVWGADHHGYVTRMKAAMQLLGHDPDELEIAITQMVDFARGGEEVKMSGRSGDFIALDDVIAEVGADAARFTYLMQSVDSRQTFDLEEVAKQGMDNPVFYVQYAHARICSIFAKAAEAGVERSPLADVDTSLLVHERELDLLRSLQELPDIVRVACVDNAPHRIAAWSREQAAALHGFYHDCYVMSDAIAPELTQARLALVAASQVGLQIALQLLGVSAPEAM